MRTVNLSVLRICCNSPKGCKGFVNHVTRQHPNLTRPQPLKDRRRIEDFSFDEGCASVLQGSGDVNKQKYGGLAKYHDLLPAKISIKQPAENNVYIPLFINDPSRSALKNFINLDAKFEAQFLFSSDSSNSTAQTVDQEIRIHDATIDVFMDVCTQIKTQFERIIEAMN